MVEFVTDVFSEQEANVIVFGVNCPKSLREASRLVEPFDIDRKKNLLEKVRFYDAGEIELKEIEGKAKEILNKGKVPLILADEHVATLHAMKAMPKDTKLVVFDAHADLKDEYEGSRFNHACWLRRLCEISDPKRVAIVGLRSCDEDEHDFMEKADILRFTGKETRKNTLEVGSRLNEFVGDSPVYMSIDMDVFDPSIAPAVRYPEPNGISYEDFLSLTGEIDERIVGADLVEIRRIPGNKVTEFLAVKVLFEVFSKVF